MAREQLPQHGQQGLGAEQRLPGRLDPPRRARLLPLDDVAAERLGQHLLPGVELEGVAQRLVVDVAVVAGLGVPADLGHRVRHRDPAGLHGGVHQVVDGHLHLATVVGVLLAEVVEEVHPVAVEVPGPPQLAPPGDQPVVDGVPLVHLRHHVLHPVPLDDAGLHEAGGGVAVDLEHLDRPVGAVGQVEAGVERRVVGLDRASYDAQRAGRRPSRSSVIVVAMWVTACRHIAHSSSWRPRAPPPPPWSPRTRRPRSSRAARSRRASSWSGRPVPARRRCRASPHAPATGAATLLDPGPVRRCWRTRWRRPRGRPPPRPGRGGVRARGR